MKVTNTVLNMHIKESLLACMFVLFAVPLWGQTAEQEAKAVIDRYIGDHPIKVSLDVEAGRANSNWFEMSVDNQVLKLKGGSGVALCRGFYDFVKQNEAGIYSWSGKRFDFPMPLQNMERVLVESPFKHHYYFNVVTYGYTMPYWDWERWEKEIDWMALHGIDMPLALVANEAISMRVWKKLGLTEEEISEYFVGPAHLPWMRMGNLSNIDGPLPKEWHEHQVALQHKILKRMKGLGMKPICPGFAGFVPQALKRIYPTIELLETQWAGAFKNWMLSPQEDLFVEIGKLFIEEWEKEFGENEFYIADSFNEMEIPFSEEESYHDMLGSYGQRIYQSISKGNPNATWVMQGWMFGYQRNIWQPETVKALLSKVPDDKMLILDLAADYNFCFWHNGSNWDLYKGFYDKPWVYSVIPNMGGKTGLTGDLAFYANGIKQALNSPNKGNLVGYGMAPEGIENNEVVYELICDAGWHGGDIDLEQWLENYSKCRYGIYNSDIQVFWNKMLASVYGTFTDHPRYNWQFRPGLVARGTINASQNFYEGVEALTKGKLGLEQNPLYVNDLIEFTALYLGGKLEQLIIKTEEELFLGKQKEAEELIDTFIYLMKSMDRLLESHSNLRLSKWIDLARGASQNSDLQNYYEKNARRIVTIWGPPIDDYSARIWSGLIRDYYLPRWQLYFDAKLHKVESVDMAAWEKNWVVNERGLSAIEPYSDPYQAALTLLNEAKKVDASLYEGSSLIGYWEGSSDKNQWHVPLINLLNAKEIRIEAQDNAPFELNQVTVFLDGKTIDLVDRIQKVDNVYYCTLVSKGEVAGNNSCVVKIDINKKQSEAKKGTVKLVYKE